METVRVIITGRIDEVPTIGQFTIDSYTRDTADFEGYKPVKYNAGFMVTLLEKQAAVNAIVFPIVLTSELKVISLRLEQNIEGLRGTMNLLEGYVVDATGLTVGAYDFGITSVRSKIKSGDAEGLNGALTALLTNITNNMAALTDAGYSAAKKTELEASKLSIYNDNAAQNVKEGARASLVVNNIGVINDYLTDIKGIWADGKRLYKLTDKVKVKDYTNTAIISRIRHDELHTLIAGTVTSSESVPLYSVKVVARPSGVGKRGKTTYTNDLGYYELKGLKPTNYLITLTMPGGAVFVTSADAITNEKVVKDFEEPGN